MKSRFPIFAMIVLLLCGTAFGGYYISLVDDDDSPCAALVTQNDIEDDSEKIANLAPVIEIKKPITEPEVQPEPEPLTPVVEEPKPEPGIVGKLPLTEKQIQDLLAVGGDKLSDKDKEIVTALLKNIDRIEVQAGNFQHTISGTVVDSFGQAVKGAQLMLQVDSRDSLQGYQKQREGIKEQRELSRLSRPAGYVRSYAITDAQGKFSFVFSTNVKEGIDALNITMHTHQSNYTKSDSQSLTIRNEETTNNLGFSLKQAGVISGRVVDSYGSPVKGARVTATKVNNTRKRNWSRSQSRQATTDAEGNFKIVGLEDGQYQLFGRATGYKVDIGKQYKVTVVTGQETYLAGDLILNKQATVSFTLTSAEGAVSGRYVVLRIYNADGRSTSSRSARIGKDGKVIVSNIPSGSIQFDVYVNGYLPTDKQYASVIGGQETELGTITLLRKASNSSAETEKLDRMRELKKKLKAVKSR